MWKFRPHHESFIFTPQVCVNTFLASQKMPTVTVGAISNIINLWLGYLKDHSVQLYKHHLIKKWWSSYKIKSISVYLFNVNYYIFCETCYIILKYTSWEKKANSLVFPACSNFLQIFAKKRINKIILVNDCPLTGDRKIVISNLTRRPRYVWGKTFPTKLMFQTISTT